MTWHPQGGYSGGKPASDMPPPARLPSQTIRPKATPMFTPLGPDDRVQALYAALIEAWHDTTCMAGPDCVDRSLHLLSAVGLERAAALANHSAVRQVLGIVPPD